MNWTFLYVALTYFSGLWLLRRGGSDFPWKVGILFYFLVVAFFFPPLVLPYTNLPLDHILGMFPWTGIFGPGRTLNPELNDVALQIAPWAHQVRESWKDLEVPLWNNAAGAGYPLLANSQSAALAPLRLLGLPLDLAQSFAFEAALKLLIALSFTFLYLRRRGRSILACVVAAASFGFCTFLLIWLHYPHATVAAFLPAVFYGLDLILERASYRRVLFLTAVFTMMLLHGQPEIAAHNVFLGSLYLLFRLFTDQDRWKAKTSRLAAVVVAGLLSICLSLPFVLPFLEAMPRSKRYDVLQSGEVLDQVFKPEVVPSLLMSFLQPRFYGSLRNNTVWGPGTSEFASGYPGVLGAVGWFAILFYRVRSGRWRDETTFWLALTPFLICIVIGLPGITDLIDSLPLYSLAANGRLRVGICWSLAILAGESIHLLVSTHDRKPIVFGLAAVAAALLIFFDTTTFPSTELFAHAVRTSAPMTILLLTTALAVLGFSNARALVLVAALLFDLWTFGWYWNPSFPLKDFYPETPLITELQRRQELPEPNEILPFHITGTGAALFPNTAAIFGLQDVRAHDPMAFGRVLGALRVFTGYTSEEYFGFLRNIDDPFLDYLNVRYVVTSPTEDYASDRFVEVYSGPDGKIYQNRDALPRFYGARNVFVEFDDVKRTAMILKHRDWANSVVLKSIPSQMIDRVRNDLFLPRPPEAPVASVKIISAKPREYRLTVDAPRWTLIIGSQPHWPGWRIYRKGERLKQIEVNVAFMGFLVPPGRSDIRIVYVPRSFYVGAQISLVTLGVLMAVLVWQNLRHGRRPR